MDKNEHDLNAVFAAANKAGQIVAGASPSIEYDETGPTRAVLPLIAETKTMKRGDLVRLTIPETGEALSARVTQVMRPDIVGNSGTLGVEMHFEPL
ncbi:hypothetical protein [Candidatus Poriferisodalis sp.]|uniref:hypothetical protein n=1 Tax=Candidatus Poriferisodalis sp. TaxID=3101277 RepID=UPI003B5BA9D9